MTELREAADHLKATYDADPHGGATPDVKAAERRYFLALEAATLTTLCPTCDAHNGPCTGRPGTAVVMWSVDHDLKCHKPRVAAARREHDDLKRGC